MLAEAQESDQILDKEQIAFLADPSIPYGQASQTTIPNTTTFQTKDLDAYDSNCDDVSNAKAFLMANHSNYGSNVISEVPHSEPYHQDIDNQSVYAMPDFEQTPVVDFTDNEITSDSNIILELPKLSLVNTSLKKLKYHLGKFDTMVKKRITPDASTEGEDRTVKLTVIHANIHSSKQSPLGWNMSPDPNHKIRHMVMDRNVIPDPKTLGIVSKQYHTHTK
ncbi:hypothetical protein Tco_0290626 [Tanacetum coccineum]